MQPWFLMHIGIMKVVQSVKGVHELGTWMLTYIIGMRLRFSPQK